MSVEDIIQRTQAYYCLQCGKCTGSCPMSRVNPSYSPRLTVEKALLGFEAEIFGDRDLWSCLACATCRARCPSDVDYSAFIRSARIEAFQAGERGVYAHNGVMQEIMLLQTLKVKQKRTGWVPATSQVSHYGEYFYFVGCLPYFDALFADIGVQATEIAQNAVRILNALGIAPVVSNDERCCGCDLLWNGDAEHFRQLARHNVELIRESGAKTVIFTCPECYEAFKSEYPLYLGPLDFQVIHLSELLSERLAEGEIKFNSIEGQVTYQDPCRLGRYLGIYEEPREIISRIPGVGFVEMEKYGSDALCCGSSGWVNCSTCSKQIQVERLGQAQASGAEVLITACPKCQIHFKCALRDIGAGPNIRIEDLTNLAARAMWGGGHA